jgi:hypothetical protein
MYGPVRTGGLSFTRVGSWPFQMCSGSTSKPVAMLQMKA